MNRKSIVTGILLYTAFSAGGCTVVRIPKYAVPAVTVPASNHFIAGAGKADLTPPPGFPSGGYSISAPIVRGQWMQLMARAIYLRDSAGKTIVIVSCDLFAIPGGLHDKVAQMLATEDPTFAIPPQNLIIVATHTHNGPGNYLTSSIYNHFASRSPGFDRRLFNFLARQITEAVKSARRDAFESQGLEHTLELKTTTLCRLARNRAVEPFSHDVDKEELLGLGQQCSGLIGEKYQAVDPTLRVLRIYRRTGAGRLVAGMLVMFSVHATTMPSSLPVYSPDFTGRAMAVIESSPQLNRTRSFVAAFINGDEGDASPIWLVQNRNDLEAASKLLTDDVFSPDVALKTDENPSLDVLASDEHWYDWGAAGFDIPHFGTAALGGAEDGRSVFYASGCGPSPKPKPNCGPSFGIATAGISLSRWALLAQSTERFPTRVPVAVTRIGGLLTIVAVPFEMTAVAGLRLRNMVKQWEGGRVVVIAGLANEYLSYMTTGEEFASQAYEGASTVFGGNSERALRSLVAGTVQHPERCDPCTIRRRSYFPGGPAQFGPEHLEKRFISATEDLDAIFPDATGRIDSGVFIATWHEPLDLDFHANLERRARVVDHEGKLVEDHGSANLVVVVQGRVDKKTLQFALVWLPSADQVQDIGKRFKFQVTTSQHEQCWSHEFAIQRARRRDVDNPPMPLTCSK